MALSNNDEPHLPPIHGLPSPITYMSEVTELEKVDIDEEKMAQDWNSDFGCASEESDGVGNVRGEDPEVIEKDSETLGIREFKGVRNLQGL